MPRPASTLLLRSLKRAAAELTRGTDDERYVDFGVELVTVRKSDQGVPPRPGAPAMVEVGERLRIGGRLDTLAKRFVGPCQRYRYWLVGERQMQIIRDFVNSRGARNRLLYSAEGGGKTVLMAMLGWVSIMLATANGLTGVLGATAPTHKRLDTLIKALCDVGPVSNARQSISGAWGAIFVDSGDIRTISGHLIQCRATKRQSDAIGSPIQGYNWGLGALMDEIQDSTDAYPDVVARLRSGKNPPILATATAKLSSSWRTFRDSLSTNWMIERIQYTDTPWVHDSHWEMMKEECSPRDWDRRALAMDVGPERMLYDTFDRKIHLRPLPTIGADDVTEEVLERHGLSRTRVLVGFDPGMGVHVSVYLKAYRLVGDRNHSWWVVGERTTHGTVDQHAQEVVGDLRARWRCNLADASGRAISQGGVACVRCDPRSDREVYTVFREAGLYVKSAAYRHASNKPGLVPKEPRIDMILALLRNVRGETRLYIQTDERGRPLASKVVESFELSERDLRGEAEKEFKGTARDLSHWTAAVGYALWFLEKPRVTEEGYGRLYS